MCVCVGVCMTKREREREGGRGREREREGERDGEVSMHFQPMTVMSRHMLECLAYSVVFLSSLTSSIPPPPSPFPLSELLNGCLRLQTTSLSSKRPVTPTQVTTVNSQLEKCQNGARRQSAISVKAGQWYQETECKINQSKPQALCCNLNNNAVGQAMPAVSVNGEVVERTSSLRYLGIHFDRTLTHNLGSTSTEF